MSRFLSAILLSGALCLPFTVYAQDHDQDHGHDQDHNQRYYDSQHKDYHQWNSDEDNRFHEYLKERHEKDRDWSKASQRQRQDFFNWEHDHPDHH